MSKDTFNDKLPHIHPTALDFKKILEITHNHAKKCVDDAVEYNKTRWEKSHKEPDFKIGDNVLLSTVNFNNLGGNKKIKPSYVGPFTIKQLHGKNAVEVILSDELSRKHPFFPVSLVKPYLSRNDKETTNVGPVPILEPSKSKQLQVHKILKEKKERILGFNLSNIKISLLIKMSSYLKTTSQIVQHT
jgi:hypothetical protein